MVQHKANAGSYIYSRAHFSSSSPSEFSPSCTPGYCVIVTEMLSDKEEWQKVVHHDYMAHEDYVHRLYAKRREMEISIPPMHIDLQRRTVTIAGQEVLGIGTGFKFDVLAVLAENVDRLVFHNQLKLAIWRTEIADNAIRVRITEVRRSHPWLYAHISSVRGYGWILTSQEVSSGGTASTHIGNGE